MSFLVYLWNFSYWMMIELILLHDFRWYIWLDGGSTHLSRKQRGEDLPQYPLMTFRSSLVKVLSNERRLCGCVCCYRERERENPFHILFVCVILRGSLLIQSLLYYFLFVVHLDRTTWMMELFEEMISNP